MSKSKLRQTDVDSRIRKRAGKLWRDAGRPAGGVEAYLEEARQLVAVEDNPKAGTESPDTGYNDPGPWGGPVEEAKIALGNEGEFPTTTDLGEQQDPQAPLGRPSSAAAHEEPNMNSDLTAEPNSVIEERIRERAYQMWIEEGRPHGRDQEHWEKARRLIDREQLKSKPAAAARPPKTDAGAATDPLPKAKTVPGRKPGAKSVKA
jgi:hypothetical protein